MYRCIFLGIAFFTANMALSQQVFGAAGNENYTLGEVFINSHISSNQILSEGFHQPVISLFEIESIDDLEISVYPNPTSGKLVMNHNLDYIDVHVYDVRGRRIEVFVEDLKSVDLSFCPQGTYSLLIISRDKRVFKSKIIIQR